MCRCSTQEFEEAKHLLLNGLIQKATNNFNNTKSTKYDLPPEQIESKSLQSEQFSEEYDFHRLQKVNEDADRSEHSDKK